MMDGLISWPWSGATPMASAAMYVAHGLGVLAIVVGVMLWLMGRRLARPACAALWVLLGVMLAAGATRIVGDAGLLPLWLIAGGILGGAAGWLLYRICLAIALCVVVGLTAGVIAHLVHVGLPSPELTEQTRQAMREAAEQAHDELLDEEDRPTTVQDALHTIARLTRGPWEHLESHWQSLPQASRQVTLMACGVGGLCGLVLGLIFPRIGALAGSSLLGTCLMAGGAMLMLWQINDAWIRSLSGRVSLCLLALGLITMMGMGVQWTLSRRRTDS